MGMALIKKKGGLTVAQDPKEAEVNAMPLAAIELIKVDHILTLDKIGKLLTKLCK